MSDTTAPVVEPAVAPVAVVKPSRFKRIFASFGRPIVKLLLKPEYRPVELQIAHKLATSVLLRAGASAAVVGVVGAIIDHFLVK